MAGQRLGPNTGNQMVVDWLAQAHLLLPLQVNLAVELSNQGVKFSLHGLVRGFSEASDPILQLPSPFSNIPNFRLGPTRTSRDVCFFAAVGGIARSEERRVGKECGRAWSAC